MLRERGYLLVTLFTALVTASLVACPPSLTASPVFLAASFAASLAPLVASCMFWAGVFSFSQPEATTISARAATTVRTNEVLVVFIVLWFDRFHRVLSDCTGE